MLTQYLFLTKIPDKLTSVERKVLAFSSKALAASSPVLRAGKTNFSHHTNLSVGPSWFLNLPASFVNSPLKRTI
jgi:hypothetical protein